MADEVIETEKVYSIEEKKFIDKPIEPKQETTTEEEKKEDIVEEEVKKEDVVTDTPDTTTEKKEEKVVEEKKPDTEIKFEPGSYIKEKWGEKFGIESEDDLNEILDAQEELIDQYKALEAKSKEPVWRNEQEKKVAEFLQGYDASRFGEGLNTIASIMGMDPDNIGELQAYKEAYILDHPHLTRDEAGELAEDEFSKKYSLNREDFDDDAAFEKRKRIVDIQKKDEVTKARRTLAAKKETLKAPAEAKKDEKTTEVKPEPKFSEETLQEYHSKIDKFFQPAKDKTFDRFTYLDDDGKTVLFNLVLDKDKQESIKEFSKKYVQSETLYDKNGKIPKFDPQDVAKTALRVLHGDWMEDQLWKQVKVLARTIKAEQIAGASPEKKSGGKGDTFLSPMDQFKKLAEKQKAGG